MAHTAVTDIERLVAFQEAERTFQMDEEAFRAFYELTARPLWAFLARGTGDGRLADDLLQETYYRLLRARASFDSDDHRRHYLFRIAANLVRDHHRRPQIEQGGVDVSSAEDPHARDGERAAVRLDVSRAMRTLKPRERTMLWLAYAQGWSHGEIAAALGLRRASLKCLLHRARRRLLAALRDPASGGTR